ncbi:MAG: hypothetical protein ACLUHA_05955 [Bacteroides stercoris]
MAGREEYILPRSVLIVILLTNFFTGASLQGQRNDQFIFGYETALSRHMGAGCHTGDNSSGGIGEAASLWGSPGVLLGDIASSITVISIWQPYFPYKEGLGVVREVILEK